MRLHSRLLVLALAAFCLPCTAAPKQQGLPFDQLPVLSQADVLAFFQAIPAQDLPANIATAKARASYFKKFRDMTENGMLADGEGPEETTPKTDNTVFWSEYFETEGQDEDYSEDKPHPYANIYVYAGLQKGRMFGIIKSGAYVDGEDKVNPDKYYWFDAAKGTMTPGALTIEPMYTVEDLTADDLLTYGASSLMYSVRNKRFYSSFYDRGMAVYIEDVGQTGVQYEWNGVCFVRDTKTLITCIYNWGFSHISIGDPVPYDIPGYKTTLLTAGEYERTYVLVKKGQTAPTLFFTASTEDKIWQVEVCSGPYCNPYGIYPGMTVEEFLKVVRKVGERFGEQPYISYNDSADDFVEIYTGIDEDFVYKVSKKAYLGNEKFAPDARIASVMIINAVG